MSIKVILVTISLLICASIVAKADLNSGTEDEDTALNTIVATNKARAGQRDGMQKEEPRASANSLSVGIKRKVDNCQHQAKKGDTLHMHYRGSLANGGQEFDNSHKRGQPFVFTLGTGQVIKGWDQGLLGICAGEVRKLIIPPHLAYGESGSPPTIPPHSTLVFEVEAVKVTPAARHEEL